MEIIIYLSKFSPVFFKILPKLRDEKIEINAQKRLINKIKGAKINNLCMKLYRSFTSISATIYVVLVLLFVHFYHVLNRLVYPIFLKHHHKGF